MARYAKASYEQKRKAMIFPFHRRPLRKIFLFTFYTYKESLSLAHVRTCTHSPSLAFSPLIFSRTSVPTFATSKSDWPKVSICYRSGTYTEGYPRVKSNSEISRIQRRRSNNNGEIFSGKNKFCLLRVLAQIQRCLQLFDLTSVGTRVVLRLSRTRGPFAKSRATCKILKNSTIFRKKNTRTQVSFARSFVLSHFRSVPLFSSFSPSHSTTHARSGSHVQTRTFRLAFRFAVSHRCTLRGRRTHRNFDTCLVSPQSFSSPNP